MFMRNTTNLLLLFLLFVSIPCFAATIYVDDSAEGINNGTSWNDAFNELYEALDAAGTDTRILVAQGTYKPDTTGLENPRVASFSMKNGVTIEGGYAGYGADDPDERDIEVYETILSGDLLGNDNPEMPLEYTSNDPRRIDNCYHVFFDSYANLDATAILDGVTITAGNARIFERTASAAGGGMLNYSSPTLTRCTFRRNSAFFEYEPSGRGGGIFNPNGSPRIISCTFAGNLAKEGGGISTGGGNPIVINCAFSDISAYYGGGMYTSGSSILTNCTFANNSAEYDGGGIYNSSSSSEPGITNCILWGNTAGASSNQMYSVSSPTYSCIEGWSGGGDGNIPDDPLFGDAEDGDFRLLLNSPCIDAGDNSVVTETTDIDGNPRIVNGIVNMGAHETSEEYLLEIIIQPFAGACTLTLDPPGGIYEPGTEVTITLDVEDGFTFNNWSGDLSGNDNPATIIMNFDKDVIVDTTFLGEIIYVDAHATGLNNGASWTNALTDLEVAISGAEGGKQIWVAAGTYYPRNNHGLWIGERGNHFRLKNDVSIYGGFDGTETALDQRNVSSNETILSGDIGSAGDPDDNCYHVFYHPEGSGLNASAVLDGFSITGGNANEKYPSRHSCGGGMYNRESSPTVRNCSFVNNPATYAGGGMYNYQCSPVVSSCTFSSNSAFYGSGMFNWRDSNPEITCSTFSGNSALCDGGGIDNGHDSNLTISNSIFWENSAPKGNEIALLDNSTVNVDYCDFQGGQAGIYDGLEGCTINWGIGNIDVDPLFVDPENGDHHLKSAGWRWDTGGGTWTRDGVTSPCIDRGNPGLPLRDEPMTVDTDPTNQFGENIRINMGAYGGTAEASMPPYEFAILSDINNDAFCNAYDLRYLASRWLDAAAGVPADFNRDGMVDLADFALLAHDWTSFSSTIYVDKDAPGANNGTSWADAYTDLQYALSFAFSGSQILVAGGTYLPYTTGLTNPRETSFVLVNGVTIEGGYAGYGADDPDERDIEVYETILSGDIGVPDDPNDNCYHVFYHPEGTGLNASAVLDGFTITGGNANKRYPSWHCMGGGMYNWESSPTVTNCSFVNNTSANGGGGIYNYRCSPVVTNCIFSDNTAFYGSGMCNWSGSSPAITGCVFSGNSALTGGGGINNGEQSNAVVTNCTFVANSGCDDAGGGICNEWSDTIVTGCIFDGNLARYGGGMHNGQSSSTVTESTFTENFATVGGGIFEESSSLTMANCIFWENSLPEGNEIALLNNSTVNVDYCDVQGGQAGIYDGLEGCTINWGVGNLDVDPLFVDPENGDLHLMSAGWRWDEGRDLWTWDDVTSLCVDAGNPGSPLRDEPLTLDVDPLNQFGENIRINMGAYGGTVEASMPPYEWAVLSDINNDSACDIYDLMSLAKYWLDVDQAIPADFNRDESVDLADFALLAYDWLEGVLP